MIETEQSVQIDVPIEGVWSYVRDIQRWANLMPGLRECTVIDDNDSHWVLKVGAGGMVRTVNVNVHVDRWDGPERVSFSYALKGDPVQGGGTYVARAINARQTEVTLKVQVVGSGPMAKMWEAMGKPLLPQFAKSFAQQLKAEIEQVAEVTGAALPAPSSAAASRSWGARLVRFLKSLLGVSSRTPDVVRK